MEARENTPRAGRVLILIGDGKGKTTSALGTALRCVGHGMRVLVVQFVKNRPCGEHAAAGKLGKLLEIRLAGTGFLPAEGKPLPEKAVEAAQSALRQAAHALASGRFGLVVLDEVLYALRRGLIAADDIRHAVTDRAEGVHVILTGDGPWEDLADLADTVTRMGNVRHAMENGRPPDPGIEF
mgnify:FL=1